MATQLPRVDRDALWTKLALTKAQVARVAGVTRRQMIYWSGKGILGDPNRRTFDGRSVEKVVLIKMGLDRGHTLSMAVEMANRALGRRRAN